MNIALMGLFGSGKSTLAQFLAKRFNMTIISSDMYTDYVKAKKPMHEIITDYRAHGKTIPNHIFEAALLDKLQGAKDGFVYENLYTVGNLNVLQKYLNFDKYILLHIDESTAIERTRSRNRPDFGEDFIKRRLAAFYDNIEELKRVTGDKLLTFDATLPIDILHEKVYNSL